MGTASRFLRMSPAGLAVLGFCGAASGCIAVGANDATTFGQPTVEGGDATSGTSGASGDSTATNATTGDGTSGDGGSSDGGGTVGAVAPTVELTTPAEGDSGVARDVTIAITFSQPMDPATVTTNTADTTCSGTVQISTDDFASCLVMGAPPASSDNVTFVLTPRDGLESTATYRIRVTAAARDELGTPMLTDFETPAGFIARYFHTIGIDGNSEFDATETLSTSTPSFDAHFAWDADAIYIGLRGPDVAAADSTKWVLVYLSGLTGVQQGIVYNTQSPGLPFNGAWHLRWRTDNGFSRAERYAGGNWVDAGWGLAGDIQQQGEFVEMRVPLADIGNPAMVDVHLSMINEQPDGEWTWAACPATSMTDGYDPDYSARYSFDLLGSVPPSGHAPL